MTRTRQLLTAITTLILTAALILTSGGGTAWAASEPLPVAKVKFTYEERGKNGVVVGDDYTASWPGSKSKNTTGYKVGISVSIGFTEKGAVWSAPKWVTVDKNTRTYKWTEKTAPKPPRDVCAAQWRATVITITTTGKSSPVHSEGAGPQAGC